MTDPAIITSPALAPEIGGDDARDVPLDPTSSVDAQENDPLGPIDHEGGGPTSYARARVPVECELSDLDRAAILHELANLRSLINQQLWTFASIARVGRIRRILLALDGALRARDGVRVKHDGRWTFRVVEKPGVEVVVAEVVVRTPGRTLEDLKAPIVVVVHEPDAISAALLAKLEAEGDIVIEHIEDAA